MTLILSLFLQVEACTEVGCGPKSVVANATADGKSFYEQFLFVLFCILITVYHFWLYSVLL